MTLCERSDMRTGEYSLSVSSDGVSVSYGGYEGLRNAISSLSYLIKKDGIPCCDISDFPDNTYRACLIDLARGYVDMDALKEHIVRMAKLKYSVLHLHLMDRQTYCLESDVVPNPDGHRLYSKEDMRELISLATDLAMEVIPEIEFPGHAVNQLKAIPTLACDLIDKRAAIERVRAAKSERKMEFVDSERGISQWAVCPGKESTYEIYERIIDEICELFPGKILHIGGDEFEFPSLAAHTHWDNCHACRARMEKEGFSSTRELYYYGLRRLHTMLRSRGKRMAAWNDQIDAFTPPDIPKDILIYCWHGKIITKESGAFQKLLDLGHQRFCGAVLFQHQHGSATVCQDPGVFLLVVIRHIGRRDQNARRSGSGDLVTGGSARPADHHIGCRHHSGHVVDILPDIVSACIHAQLLKPLGEPLPAVASNTVDVLVGMALLLHKLQKLRRDQIHLPGTLRAKGG